MGKTMSEKILGGVAGQTVTVKPDYLLLNDGASHKAVELVEENRGLANKDKVIIVIDHDVPAGNSDSSAIFVKLVDFSKKYGVEFIQSEGIGYKVLLDKYVKPGEIVVSCGTHNSIFGAVGALGFDVNTHIMSTLLMKGEYEITVPQTVAVELNGKLPKNTSAIDLFIKFLGDTVENNFAGRAIEFIGEGIKSLSKRERTVLCSMATRTGAYTAFVNENPEGLYVKTIAFNLEDVQPVAALPSQLYFYKPLYNYKSIKKLTNIELDAGFIGGYTGGHIEDLRIAAKAMKGKKIALGFRLCVSPVSSDVYIQAMEEGLIETFIDFGAQILPPSDRNRIAQGAGVIDSGEKMITTGSYNYPGCLGSEDSEVYIASTSSVVASAISKSICKL
ncbi:aconitase family protein [Wukongibacter sp. M2B1]|uniref:aconitase family protein n=1 Tax=Wukongibacter sp. M2B1 TaxID=3088895 RepID=UPI003D7914B3